MKSKNTNFVMKKGVKSYLIEYTDKSKSEKYSEVYENSLQNLLLFSLSLYIDIITVFVNIFSTNYLCIIATLTKFVWKGLYTAESYHKNPILFFDLWIINNSLRMNKLLLSLCKVSSLFFKVHQFKSHGFNDFWT